LSAAVAVEVFDVVLHDGAQLAGRLLLRDVHEPRFDPLQHLDGQT